MSLDALPHGDVAAALAKVRATGAFWSNVAAFEFVTLTATRSGETRGARWEEIDGDTWTIPADRMKAGVEHRVPLSTAALDVLDTARAHTGGVGLIFPSATGRVIADKMLLKLRDRAGITGGTVHGMRSSFRDWAAERGTPDNVAEAALAHTVKNAVEAAYRRTYMLDARRPLMQDWAAYLSR